MPGAGWTWNLKTEENKAFVKRVILEETEKCFELDIKPEAVQNSPVRTGTNRRSLDTEVTQVAGGVEGSLFGQSGYSGYLEVGTRYMRAQPYMWPAFKKGLSKLFGRIQQRLR